jgi:hypothetical protein
VCTKDSCWSVEIIYDSRELPGVSIAGPGVDGVLQFINLYAAGMGCICPCNTGCRLKKALGSMCTKPNTWYNIVSSRIT